MTHLPDKNHLIEAQDLSRTFGKADSTVLAVDGISIRLAAGEFCILMGPSGSGKTTLLAMLGGILQPTSGRIRMMGKDLVVLSSKERARLRGAAVGFVFQGFNLLSSLTALENVALVADFLPGRPRNIRSRCLELLSGMGLGDRIHHLPADLSAGEKQRVAFARALVNDPKMILADEPTANLDAENRDMVVGLLRRAVNERSVTVILATHDERIRRDGDRVIRIEYGRLTKDVVYDAQHSDQVKR